MRGKRDETPATYAPETEDVRRAISKLTSLREGDRGLIDTVACGTRAVPPLRALLFSREPSGLHEIRRRAVEALGQLQAYEALIEYLRKPRAISDPIEQVGEEAVINAAARAVARSRHAEVVPLLLDWAQRPPLAGVVDALGALRLVEALPYFIGALAEDSTRFAAEEAIRNLGVLARDALLKTALRTAPPDEQTVSCKRQRRSALKLYGKLGPPSVESWPSLRRLMQDEDLAIAAAAGRICLEYGESPDETAATLRLIDLLGAADWPLSEEIENCLVEHYASAGAIIGDRLRRVEGEAGLTPVSRTIKALRRIAARSAGETLSAHH